MKRLIFLGLFVLLISCEKELLELDALGSNAGIVGTWVEEEYQGDTLLLHRSARLLIRRNMASP